jgi:H+/gluconate symporter-like permease
MLGLFGLIISLTALIYFAYKGVNVLLLAPLCALIAVLFQPDLMGSASQGILLTQYTQVFMTALSKYVLQYFPVF